MDHSQMTHIWTDEGLVMVHDGIPGWLFGLGVGLVILLSFVLVEWRGLKGGEGFRINLTRKPAIHRLVRKRWFQFALQAPILVLFGFTIYAGLFGSFVKNIAPVVTWTIWWAALIFAVAMLGNIWCMVCPWDAMANLAQRLSFWRKKESLSMGLELPPWLRNVYPALALFVVLTWLELGFGVTNNPRQTATMGLGMVGGAMAMALVFDKKAFCTSFCFVGRVSGMYSNFSPVEIRPRDLRVCEVCTTRDCLVGNDKGFACPTGIDLGTTQVNSFCTGCTECFKSCPSLAPAIRIRGFGKDLHRGPEGRRDEAWFALTLLALTAFHGLSMTPVWENYEPGTADIVGFLTGQLGMGKLTAFSLGMGVASLVPIAAYLLCTGAAAAWVKDSGVGFWKLFESYAWSVLPVALFYHLAHNAMHLFTEGQDIVPLLSDPLGRGSDWFGTADMHLEPLLSLQNIWYLQVLLIVIGHIFGVVVSHRISRRLFQDEGVATRSLIPMLVMMVILSVGGLWLMSLDMNMRVGRM